MYPDTTAFYDVDIVFNANSNDDIVWTADPNDVDWDDDNNHYYLIQLIATHEIGHMLGLYHYNTTDANSKVSIMTGEGGLRVAGRWDNWDLNTDDIFGAAFLTGTIMDDILIGGYVDCALDWDITIKNNATLTVCNYSPVNSRKLWCNDYVDIIVDNGTMRINGNNITLTKKHSTNWNGIDVKTNGTLDIDNDCTVEYAVIGVDLQNVNGFDNANGANRVTIQNCSNWGMQVYNVAPNSIKNVFFNNNISASVSSGGIKVSGSSADPTFDRIAIANGDYGLYIYGTTANMVRSDIYSSNSDHSIRLDISGSDIDLDYGGDPIAWGNNKIMPDTANNKKAIYRSYSTPDISAVGNWWGMTPVNNSTLFYPSTGVTTTYAHADSSFTSGIYKTAVLSENLFEKAREYEKQGAYDDAYSLYKELLLDEKNISFKKKILKSLMRIKETTKNNSIELENVLLQEQNTATGEYAAFLDYFICDLAAKTGNYSKAVSLFENKLPYYRGTPMELEMLCRLATIYGNDLDHVKEAREYANMVAKINAGYGLLDVAYGACGISYDPSLYVDTTANLFYPERTAPKNTISESVKPTVSISPNPANPATTIAYTLPAAANAKLSVYSVSGQKVATLVDGFMSAGNHAAVFDGSNLASGVYFYRLEAKGFSKTGKMTLVK